MAVLQESLPLSDFACILEMSDNQVEAVQTRLTALQTRGTFDKRTVTPASQHFHSSFVEFTMSRETEAGDALVSINPQIAHESIAEGCLTFLSEFLSSLRGSERIHADLHVLEVYAVAFWPLHSRANSNGRSMPLATKLKNLLLAENHLRNWGSCFLAISLLTSSQNWDEVLGGIDGDGFYCSLVEFLTTNMAMDTTLASHRTVCLEVALPLQPKLLKAWEDLGDSCQKQFDSTVTVDFLNHEVIVYRLACSKDGSRLPTSTSGLANALQCRFRKTGSMTDLDKAP